MHRCVLLKILAVWFALLFSCSVLGQERSPALLLPWEFPGVSADERRKMRPLIEKANELFSATVPSQTLSAWSEAKGELQPKTINLTQRTREVRAWKPNSAVRALTPVWCSLGKQQRVAIALIWEWPSGYVNRMESVLVQRQSLETVPSDPPGWDQSWPQKWVEQISELKDSNDSRLEGSRLKLELVSGRLTGITEGVSATCLNLLLIKGLTSQYRITLPLGRESMVAVRQRYFGQDLQYRSNIKAQLHWSYESGSANPWKLSARLSEGTMGQSLGRLADLEVGVLDTEFVTPAPLKKALDEYRANLLAGDLPQVVKKDRAWVWVDRGRAWGLRLRDRLVNANGSVAGHVIGFYGPEMRLMNLNKRLIAEGAIVFVRKGQGVAQVGDALGFDPERYPAPLP